MDIRILLITALLTVLDVVFGFAGAVKCEDVKSGKLREGLWHKTGYVGLIAVAYILQEAAAYADLGFEAPTVLAYRVCIVVTELVSIVENICVLNPDLKDSPLGIFLGKGGG